MFNKDLVEQLKKLNSITDSVIMRYPVTTMVSNAGDILCNLKVDNFDTDNFEEFGLYELSKLINLFGLFKNYEVENKEDCLIIKAGPKSAVLKKSELFLLEDFDKKSSVIETTKNSEKAVTVSSFTICADDVMQLKKAGSILSETEGIKFEGIDGDTKVGLININRFESSGDTFGAEFFNTSNKNFNIKITKENFNKLPNCDYDVIIKYNEAQNVYRIIFSTDNFDIMVSTLAY